MVFKVLVEVVEHVHRVLSLVLGGDGDGTGLAQRGENAHDSRGNGQGQHLTIWDVEAPADVVGAEAAKRTVDDDNGGARADHIDGASEGLAAVVAEPQLNQASLGAHLYVPRYRVDGCCHCQP